MADSYVIEGFVFQNRNEYERAQKERETIAYLSANTDMTDMKAVYKLYKHAVEKRSFQTVFGLKYMEELRKKLVGSGIVTEDVLPPVPVARVLVAGKQPASPVSAEEKQLDEYKAAYEKAKSGSLIKNMLIIVLLLLIAVMVFITYKNQYSIFTYFTDYKEDMREEILNEYEEWEQELQQREKKLEERENAVENGSSRDR